MIQLNPEQEVALEAIKEWANEKGPTMISLTGFAGTGKTTIATYIKGFVSGVAYTALTGRAALRLSEAAEVQASTLHSVLYDRPDILKGGKLEFNKLSTPSFKFLVVDEASMTTPQIYEDLKQWNQYYKIRILFIGDAFQLPPILTEEDRKKTNEFSIFSEVDGPKLTQIMRNGDAIIEAATVIREQRKIPKTESGPYSLIQVADPITYTIDQYLSDPNDHIIITWRNRMRMEANHMVRNRLGHTSYLPDEGEPIIFCRNGQGVLNGQIAMIKQIVQGPVIAGVITYRVMLEDKKYILCSVTGKNDFMDGQMPYVKDWKGYMKAQRANNYDEPIPITYGYVSTAHKAQGNEFRRVSVMLQGSDINNIHFRAKTTLPDGKTAPFGIRWIYTSVSRAKTKVELIVGT